MHHAVRIFPFSCYSPLSSKINNAQPSSSISQVLQYETPLCIIKIYAQSSAPGSSIISIHRYFYKRIETEGCDFFNTVYDGKGKETRQLQFLSPSKLYGFAYSYRHNHMMMGRLK